MAASLLLAASAHAVLPPGVSGAWYNPLQSGHGLSIKIIAPDRALVYWYAYDLEGNPLNLYIDGRIQGRRIEATALAPRGMRFGSFDPAELVMPAWGQVSIEIDDCDGGRLSWDADDPAFGSGSVEIVRLAGIDAHTCQFGQSGPLAGGLYAAGVTTQRFGVGGNPLTAPGIAAVDPDGTLWGFELLLDGHFGTIPGPTSFLTDRQVIHTSFTEPSDSDTGIVVRATLNTWARGPLGTLGPVQGIWQPTAGGELSYRGVTKTAVWAFRPSVAELVQPLTSERLEGVYSLKLDGQLAATHAEIEIGADAGLCLRYLIVALQDTCELAGRYWLVDGEEGFLDFELFGVKNGRAEGLAYRGRGWLQADADGEAIVLVGDDGYSGLGLIAR